MGLVIFNVIIKGKSKVISTSKIKKITAIKKKWRENGRRAEEIGSNPHSKGDLFSRSIKVFFEIKFTIKIIRMQIAEITIENSVRIIIFILKKRSFDWKSNIIFILYKYLPHQ